MRHLFLLVLITTVFAVHAAPLEQGLIDDTHPVLAYSGTWIDGIYSDAYGGGYQMTSDDTGTLSFETYALGVTIFFIYDALGDDIEVCIEDDCITVSTLGATSVGRVELSDLPSGLKTITLMKVTSDASVFNFDAIYVHPSESEVSAQITEFEYEGQVYTGIMDLRVTSGDALIVLMLAIVVCFLMFNLILQVGNK